MRLKSSCSKLVGRWLGHFFEQFDFCLKFGRGNGMKTKKYVANILKISSILGIKPVGPYERILRLRHSFILSFFHVRSHSNEGIFGSFSGSPTCMTCNMCACAAPAAAALPDGSNEPNRLSFLLSFFVGLRFYLTSPLSLLNLKSSFLLEGRTDAAGRRTVSYKGFLLLGRSEVDFQNSESRWYQRAWT